MKVFVLGANGMLGQYVYRYFQQQNFDVDGITRNEGFDARNFYASSFVDACMRLKTKPFTVINCVGAIKQRYSNAEDLFALNGTFPVELAQFLYPLPNANMIHISTDCVFSGYHGRYVENDMCDAKDYYGQSKIVGEQCSKLPNCKVVRTSIIGEDKRNSSSFLEWVRSRSGGVIDGYTNHLWNGVTCLTAAKVCRYLTQYFDTHNQPIYHVFSEEVSKFALAEMIAGHYDLNIGITPVEASIPIDRTLYTHTPLYNTPSLAVQIREQKEFVLP